MGKISRKKERIKLNEVLNNRLDSMEDSSALDVFTPKKDMNMDLMNLVNESLEKETGKRDLKNTDGSGIGTTIGIIFIIVLFFFFVYLMYNMIF